MRSKPSSRRYPSRRPRKQNSPAAVRCKKEIQRQITRLNAILQDPLTTAQQKAVAQLQIAECQESAAMVLAPPADWLRQMDLLAE